MAGIFSRKNLDEILKEAEEPGHTLKRALGPLQITLLGIGAIIGAGIFATIGTAAAGDAHRLGAGPGMILSFGLAALVCAFAALCYAEFASMVPISGSAYTYAYATLGEVVAWIIGWDLIIEYAVGNVAVAISWANYFKTLMRECGVIIPDWISTDFLTAQKIPGLIAGAPHVFGIPIVFNALAISIVVAITLILLVGIRESAWFNAGMVMFKLVVLGFFVWVGTHYTHTENWHPFLPNGWAGVSAGAAVIFFAYIGFDAVSTVAEEAKNPQKDLPIGIISSLILCTIIYIVVAAVFIGMIPYSALVKMLSTQQAEPLTLALDYVHLKGATVLLVALGSVIAHTAVLFVFQLGQPRIFFSMARDGLLPGLFAKVHPRFRTPWGSTILTGVGVGVFSMFTSLDQMVDLTNIGTLFAFILVSMGIIILRVREPERKRPFRVPGGIVLPILGIIGCLYLIRYLPTTSWSRFVAWLNIGFVIYMVYGSVKSRLTGRDIAANPGAHDAITAFNGAWLAVIGIILLVLTHSLSTLLGNEPDLLWVSVPLVMNVVLLCPAIVLRAARAKRVAKPSLDGAELQRAHTAMAIAAIIMVISVGYLAYLYR